MKQLTITAVGHVDHGKSTLLGRLLYETGAVPPERLATAEARSAELGRPFEFAFLLDALEEEQRRNITIDLCRFQFASRGVRFVLIDAPGHKEFLKNMVSGAASADGAILLVDASEGMRDQTRRHAYLLRLLGIRQIVVAINKMDRVDHSRSAFEDNRCEIEAYLAGLGLHPVATLPIAARSGANVASRATELAWFSGPTLLEQLEALEPTPALEHLPVRFPVQDVYERDGRRFGVGRIEAGTLQSGAPLAFTPSGAEFPAVVFAPQPQGRGPWIGRAGDSIALELPPGTTLERGDIGAPPDAGPHLGARLDLRLFWLGAEPLRIDARYTLRLATVETGARVHSIERVIRTESLESQVGADLSVEHSDVAEVVLQTDRAIPFDRFSEVPTTGRVVLIDGGNIVGGGILS